MDTDVLIVGAGPTGLMLANQLGRRGIRVQIIDRHRGPAQQTRAMAVHARTLEIYSKLGIAEQALARGQRGGGGNLWANGKRTARIPIGDIGQGVSPFPFVLTLGQDENERIMGAHLASYGIAVQWNTELTALEQEDDRVVATLKNGDGSSRRMTALYVAGCDGGRSSVRELNGIGFPGEPYPHTFFVADTEATGSMVPDELNIYLWRDGFHLFFPMRGTNRWRLIGILPEEFRTRDGLTFEELIPSLRREAGSGLAFQGCDWFSTYRIHHRVTERFRKGRCLLLGDAAHVHSPMGGQGMNTGLQDAYNLAWKLALVVEGRADDTLLDTYEAERMKVARRLLNTTDRAFRLLVSRSPLAAIFRTQIFARVAAFAMRRERARRVAFRTLSMIGIGYPDSALSHTVGRLPDDAPRAGDRFPWVHLKFTDNGRREDLFERLDDTRFNLLVVGQPVPSDLLQDSGGLLRVHVAAEGVDNVQELKRVGVTAPAFYLLRPDGHVALAGAECNATVIERWFVAAGIDRWRSAAASPAVVPQGVRRRKAA